MGGSHCHCAFLVFIPFGTQGRLRTFFRVGSSYNKRAEDRGASWQSDHASLGRLNSVTARKNVTGVLAQPSAIGLLAIPPPRPSAPLLPTNRIQAGRGDIRKWNKKAWSVEPVRIYITNSPPHPTSVSSTLLHWNQPRQESSKISSFNHGISYQEAGR